MSLLCIPLPFLLICFHRHIQQTFATLCLDSFLYSTCTIEIHSVSLWNLTTYWRAFGDDGYRSSIFRMISVTRITVQTSVSAKMNNSRVKERKRFWWHCSTATLSNLLCDTQTSQALLLHWMQRRQRIQRRQRMRMTQSRRRYVKNISGFLQRASVCFLGWSSPWRSSIGVIRIPFKGKLGSGGNNHVE